MTFESCDTVDLNADHAPSEVAECFEDTSTDKIKNDSKDERRARLLDNLKRGRETALKNRRKKALANKLKKEKEKYNSKNRN